LISQEVFFVAGTGFISLYYNEMDQNTGSFTSKTNCFAIVGFFVKNFNASNTFFTKKPASFETGFTSSGNWTCAFNLIFLTI